MGLTCEPKRVRLLGFAVSGRFILKGKLMLNSKS